MSERGAAHLLGMRLLFGCTVCIILFFNLLPVETSPRPWVGPDQILLFALAWSARRPEYVPVLWLAALFLLADLLLFRPPGLLAAFALLACERMKTRARTLRDGSFLNEWLTVCVLVALVAVGHRAVMLLTLLEPPPFGLSVFEVLSTMVFYPLVVAVTHVVFGVRRAAPGELETARGAV